MIFNTKIFEDEVLITPFPVKSTEADILGTQQKTEETLCVIPPMWVKVGMETDPFPQKDGQMLLLGVFENRH